MAVRPTGTATDLTMSELLQKAKVEWRSIPSSYKKAFALAVGVFVAADLLFFGMIASLFTGAEVYSTNYKYSMLPGRPKRKLRIAVVTHHSGDAYGYELNKLTQANKQKYCDLHGYDLYDANAVHAIAQKIAEDKPSMRNFYFFKYRAMFEVLQGGEATGGKEYDWVVWSDADSIYLNMGKRYEEIIDERFDAVVTIGAPDHPQWRDIVNAGSLMIKNTEWGQQFLDDILHMSKFPCQEFLEQYPEARTPINGWLQVCSQEGHYWLSDQGILQALFTFREAHYKCHVKKTWFRVMNSEFPWYGDGDMVVHFPGRQLDDRKKLIKAFFKYANFKNGKVNRKRTDLLDTDEAMTNDLVRLEELYADINPTCEVYSS